MVGAILLTILFTAAYASRVKEVDEHVFVPGMQQTGQRRLMAKQTVKSCGTVVGTTMVANPNAPSTELADASSPTSSVTRPSWRDMLSSHGITSEKGSMQDIAVAALKAVVEGQRTAAEGTCAASKCHATTHYYCWQKTPGEAYCKEKCPEDWMCVELEGENTLVPVARDSDGTSLYCFSACIKNRGVDDADDYSLDMLQSQIKVKTGIFACDEWRVFSDVHYGLSQDGSATTVQVFGDDFQQQRCKDLGQWVTSPLSTGKYGRRLRVRRMTLFSRDTATTLRVGW